MQNIKIVRNELSERNLHRIYSRLTASDPTLSRYVLHNLIAEYSNLSEFIYLMFIVSSQVRGIETSMDPLQQNTLSTLHIDFRRLIYGGEYSIDVSTMVELSAPHILSIEEVMREISIPNFLNRNRTGYDYNIGNAVTSFCNNVFGLLGLTEVIPGRTHAVMAVSVDYLHCQVMYL